MEQIAAATTELTVIPLFEPLNNSERRGDSAETQHLVADVLQEPFGGNLTAEAGAFRKLVNFSGYRVKLGALQIAALRIGDLLRRGAPLDLAGDEVGERDAPIRQ